jgi:DNA replication and repair protein RecF
MRVRRVALRDFRNHVRTELALEDGVTVLQGPVGAGKTNLLEALYFGCAGRSFRTSNERELIRFGERSTYVSVETLGGGTEHLLEAALELPARKLLKVDGARSERVFDPDVRPLLCVFVPDRLGLVKGAAGLRRAHLDELVAALWPSRRQTRRSYARALAQRNSLLGRLRAGRVGSLSSLAGWNRELARHGFDLMADRRAAVALLSPRFAERAGELGLEHEASAAYKPRSHANSVEELEHELEESAEADAERGFTTHGPHRDDLGLELDERNVRRFGSQGQQRLVLLTLLLAERDALAAAHRELPVLLLDDVLSELDAERRERLLELLHEGGQTVITTADPRALEDQRLWRFTVRGGTAAVAEAGAPA